MSVSIADQLKCAEREVAMRKRVYPRWVASMKMTQAMADAQIAGMEAIVVTLQTLAAQERLI